MSEGTRYTWALGVILCAAAGCAVAPGGEAGPGEDVSVTLEPILGGQETTSYPEATLLDMRSASGLYYACSAVLVAPHVVLTAGHCVDGMVSWDAYAGAFHAVSTRGETFDWHENGATTVNPDHHDVGLVYLDEPIFVPTFPSIASTPVPDGSGVLDVGRVDDGVVTSAFYRAPVRVSSADPIGYPYDYYAADVIQHGDSGGPVFLPSTHTIVAVNSGANPSLEVLARVDLVREWIEERIASVEGWPEAGAPDASPADAGTGAAQRPAAPVAGACARELEPNDTPAQANGLSRSACGALGDAADVDWFTADVGLGVVRVRLEATGDAVLAVGYMTRQGTCDLVIPPSAALRGAAVTVSGSKAAGSVPICLSVTSPAHQMQGYALTIGR